MTLTDPDKPMEITHPIRHYKNSHGEDEVHVVRYSKSIADLLAGSHDISMLSNQEKAQAVFALYTLNRAKDACGWIEHTNDWDWGVGFLLVDDTYVGDEMFDPHSDPNDYETIGPFCDDFTIKWDHNFPSIHSTDEGADATLAGLSVHVEIWHDARMAADEVLTKVIRLDQIHTIYISER